MSVKLNLEVIKIEKVNNIKSFEFYILVIVIRILYISYSNNKK